MKSGSEISLSKFDHQVGGHGSGETTVIKDAILIDG